MTSLTIWKLASAAANQPIWHEFTAIAPLLPTAAANVATMCRPSRYDAIAHRGAVTVRQMNDVTHARNTTAASNGIRDEIEQTLHPYVADRFTCATPGNMATVILVMSDRRMRFVLESPDPNEFRYTNHNPPREHSRTRQEARDTIGLAAANGGCRGSW